MGARDFKLFSHQGVKWLACRRLQRLGWVLHAFSTRCGGLSEPPAGGLNLGFTSSDRRLNVEENRRLFFRAIGGQQFSLAALRQIHSASIYQVVGAIGGRLEYLPSGYPGLRGDMRRPPAGDALITNQPGILLSVRGADCLPVLLIDEEARAVAAIHAGWRGVLKGAVEKTAGVMRQLLESDPGRMIAVLGPSIRSCCYMVGEEVVSAFCGGFVNGERFFRPARSERPPDPLTVRYPQLFLSQRSPGHRPKRVPAACLDLVEAGVDQLRNAGVLSSNIHVSEFCTACRTDLFFSHRKEGAQTGRLMAVIGIQPAGRS